MIATATMLAALAIANVNYACTLTQPQSLVREKDRVELRTIEFPGFTRDDWKLDVRLTGPADQRSATVAWPKDPVQIGGEHPVLDTSDGSFAFMSAVGGGCMFTETACLTTVHMVDDKDGARMVIMPTALASDREAGTREPFTVIIEGRCTRNGAGQ